MVQYHWHVLRKIHQTAQTTIFALTFCLIPSPHVAEHSPIVQVSHSQSIGHGAVSHSAISESKGAGHSYPPLVGGTQSRCLDIVPTLPHSPIQSLHSPQKDHLKLVVSGPASQ